jgi:hypothetical protein
MCRNMIEGVQLDINPASDMGQKSSSGEVAVYCVIGSS